MFCFDHFVVLIKTKRFVFLNNAPFFGYFALALILHFIAKRTVPNKKNEGHVKNARQNKSHILQGWSRTGSKLSLNI